MSDESTVMAPFALALVAWLLTYLAHSTVALGGAWLMDRRLRRPADRDALWKVALVAALLTSTAQSTLGYAPLAGLLRLDVETARAAVGTGIAEATPQATLRESGSERGPQGTDASAGSAPDRAVVTGTAQRSVSRTVTTASSAAPAADVTPLSRRTAAMAAGATATLLAAWSLVTALLLLRLVLGHRRLRRQLDDRRPLEEGHLLVALSALAAEAGLRRPVRLTVTERCSTPLAIGRSEVCVPARFLEELAPAAQRAALAHEVAHLARRDPFWQLLAAALEAVFFLQPLHRPARRRLRETAELLCDDWAAERSGGSGGLDLARCLLAVSEWLRQGASPAPREVLAMAEGGPGLAHRIERLLAGRSAGAGRVGIRAVAAAVALVATAAAAPAVVGTAPASDGRSAAAPVVRASSAGSGGGVRGASGDRGDAASALEVRRAPAAGLDAAWQWAESDAAARGERAWWLVWSTAGRIGSEEQALTDSHGNAFADLSGPAIVRRLGIEDEVTGPRLVDQIVIFIQRAGGREQPVRVAVRSPYLAMRLSAPVYWLGNTKPESSLQRLRGVYELSAGQATGGAVVEAIALHETPGAVDFLAEVLGEGPDRDRAEAAEGLAYWPGERATALLYDAAIGDRSAIVAAEAAETLGSMPSELALPRLRELVRGDGRTAVAMEAVEALGDMTGAAGVELLDEVIAESEREALVAEAVESLGALPLELAEPRLRRVAAEHPMRGAREEAWETLGESVGDDVPGSDGEYEYGSDDEYEYEYPHDSSGEPEVGAGASRRMARQVEWHSSRSELPARMPRLLLAAANGDANEVERLLAAGADPNEAVPHLGTPLIHAAAAGHLRIVERLLAAGADAGLVEASSERYHDLPRTALGAAARGGHQEVAERLVAAGAPVDLAPPGDPTPLMYAAEGGHLGTLELLLANGADAGARIRGDGTPLIAAVRGGNPKAVARLLDAGADPNVGVRGDETPLHQAVDNRDARLVRLLLERGARPDLSAAGAESPLAVATENGDLALVRLMMPYARTRPGER